MKLGKFLKLTMQLEAIEDDLMDKNTKITH